MSAECVTSSKIPSGYKGIIKVCGMSEAHNIRDVERAGADWMGFIFYPKSSRYVSVIPHYLPDNAKRVGVFVNEKKEKILETVSLFGLDLVQLHGDETPAFCDEIGKNGLRVIKTFSIGNDFPSETINAYHHKCDYFLFDTKTPQYGGSGKKFNWDILSQYHGETSFLLSGGISHEDMDAIVSFSHPQFIGIDINSQFEIKPALKDVELVKQFIDKIREPRAKIDRQ